ncbi:ATP-grasp domain-containing protein [Butyrivibrio sp. MC2021]|uniref:ATP-grasp domain-containing protein n=1 Tax=Butyrivibrio sp. MC2021 TaxID=1408306 RepID=UPI00047DBD1D|nr:ATP-grasp domain-containing protein [Butyrivibrio sp. MC2021]
MLKTDLRGKKLLLVGGLNNTVDLFDLAHRNGVTVGVADYNKGTLAKSLADYAHDINAYDEDAMAKLIEDEHYDGVITAFNERLGPIVRKLADRVGLPFPFTVEQLKMSTNKKFFKHTCMEYGVPVPKEYIIETIEDIDNKDIEYPVIIKPVDCASSVGVTPCFDADELKKGFEKAKNASKSGDVIVEQYLPYDEINMTFIAQDGDIQLVAVHDRYFNTEQKSATKAPDLYIYPSRYTSVISDKYKDAIIKMFKGIGVENGSLFIQAVIKGDQLYCYEAGMRLNGCKTYQILEVENDYNTFEHLMHFALTGSMGEHVDFDPAFKKWYATVNVLGRPGATITEVRGEKALNSYPWLIHIARRDAVGHTIPADAAGTLVQDTTRIHLVADTKEQLKERLDKTNELFRMLDENGDDLILTPHNTTELLKEMDYEL